MRYGVWSLLMSTNHDRQRLDSSLVYTGAHNVYYVKSCLSDAKCFSGSRYSVTKAIPFQSGIFADVWRVTQERYYQVKKVCRSALINPALICLEQFGVSFSKQTLTIANDL